MLPDPQTITQNPHKTPTGSLAILIAEDNMLIQQTLKFLFSKFRITPTFANNGKQAVDCMMHNHFDFLLMDLQMPVMDGLEATKVIRQFNSQIPIVAFTSQSESSVKEQIQSAGMNDYLSKVAAPNLIYETILRYTGAAA
jgi:two-component system, sensor histidine kinase